jgi:CRP-like cAMP-binding protein
MQRRRLTSSKASELPHSAPRSRNAILGALPSADYTRIYPLLTPVALKQRQVLLEAGERLTHVYFPIDGVCSIVTTMEDGRMVEVASVGNEGLAGVGAVFGGRHTSGDIIVQIAGSAMQMPAEQFSSEIGRHGAFFERTSRYVNALLGFAMQSAACSGLHAADQRCARWLLHSHDRIRKDVLEITQEFVAVMLGVRRATITVIASEFQRAGLVEFGRRRVRILDRPGLEGMACECYRVIKDRLDQLRG